MCYVAWVALFFGLGCVILASLCSCLSVGSLRAGIESVCTRKGLPLMLDVVFAEGEKQTKPF